MMGGKEDSAAKRLERLHHEKQRGADGLGHERGEGSARLVPR